MSFFKKAAEKNLWWRIGIPIFAAMLTWGPYVLRAAVLGHHPIFRIPFVGDAVFDTAAYLQPVGHAALGIPESALIGPFARVVGALAAILPDASVAELWLLTRWMSAVASIWIGAWAVRRWTGIGTRGSRLLSLALWIALGLVLGMKPGVFSWFLPCGLIGFAAVPIVDERLRERRTGAAIGWSVLAFLATSVYAWYQLFILPWLAVIWFASFASHSIRRSSIWFGIGAFAAAAMGIAASFWIGFTEQGTVFFQLYERLSFSETRMLFISGSVLMTALWIPLLIPILRRVTEASPEMRRIRLAFIAWITLLLVFFHSPFTGHFIQNDHFRSPAAIAAWLSLALLWNISKTPPISVRPFKYERTLILIPLAVSGIFTIKILAAPYAWNGDLVNVVQLAHWFALFAASWIAWRWIGGARPFRPLAFASVVAIGTLVIGVNAWAFTLTREYRSLGAIEQIGPVIGWVEQNIPAGASICTDHGGEGFSLDDQLSAITGRVVHFAHTTLYHRERSIAFLDRMRTVAGFYDLRGSGDEAYWRLQSSLNDFIVCDQYPYQRRLFKKFGMSELAIDGLLLCPRTTINARWAYVEDAISHPAPDAEAFKKICPFIIVPDRMKPFWHLPAGYEEHRVMNGISAYELSAKS